MAKTLGFSEAVGHVLNRAIRVFTARRLLQRFDNPTGIRIHPANTWQGTYGRLAAHSLLALHQGKGHLDEAGFEALLRSELDQIERLKRAEEDLNRWYDEEARTS